jgi:hypothetical protein
MRLAMLLLALVAGCHYLYDPLSLLYEKQAAAAPAIFYILRGIEGAALFAIIATLRKSPMVLAVCAWGMYEESQTAICRLSRGIANQPAYGIFEGICGRGWYSIGLIVALALATLCLDRENKK